MPEITRRHVLPNFGGGWIVRKPGASRNSSFHDCQADAILRAVEILKRLCGGLVVVHGRDGRIRKTMRVHPDV